MDAEKTTQVYNFPSTDASSMPWLATMMRNNGIDASTLAALMNNNNNGFFGGNGGWLAMIILFAIFGGGFGNGFGWGNNGANGALGLLNTDNGINTVLNALTGTNNDIANLATALNVSTNQVQNGINSVLNGISNVGNQVGLTSAQVINALQSGNASLTNQLCQCCCENRLAMAEQTNALQSNLAAHDANVRFQLAQLDGEDKLAICQQTDQLGSQADRNANSILSAISAQSVMINDKFCDLEKRELQGKIDALSTANTNLRGQIDNANQTAAINAYVASLVTPIQSEVASIKASMPNTVPVQWPNLTAVNTTPYVNGGFYGGYGWNGGLWS